MASANRESGSSSGGPDLLMQRQQQELIKLLAQHFHHQFYHSVAANSLNLEPAGSLLSESLGGRSAYQQRSFAHNSEASLLDSSNPLNRYSESSSLNLATTSGDRQLPASLQDNLSNRSQPDGALPAASITSPPTESRGYLGGVDFSSQSLANTYPLSDVNLFNALGLNLTNNQLVLSLHQQHSLLQAAAARQFEMRNEYEGRAANRRNSGDLLIGDQFTGKSQERPSRGQQQQKQQQQQLNLVDKKNEMLKFSINTILGSGAASPTCNTIVSSSAGAMKANTMLLHSAESRSSCSPDVLVRENARLGLSTKKAPEADQQHDGTIDCDHIESSSDSSSPNASTSLPQPDGCLTSGQSLAPVDHRCANMNNGVGNATFAQQQQQNPLRQHSQHQHHYHHQSLPFLPGSAAFPWTVAARGKPRRGMMRRAVFSDSQRVGLEKRFQMQKYISKPDRKKLAEKLGLRDSQVKIWFQNRRMKWRNSKERELLSAGGSREQTLPTRNNPNPDLSDVGETIKRLTSSASTTPTVP